MFPRRRCISLVIKLFSVGFLSLCALLWLRDSAASKSTKEVVDGYLDGAISNYLTRSHMDSDPLSFARGSNSSLDYQEARDALACYIETGTWEYLASPTGPGRVKQHEMVLRYTPPQTCFENQSSPSPSPAAQFCTLLRGKEILFVGPDTTFYLHTLWLNALSIQDSRTYTCLGAEFCTFHHICQGPPTGMGPGNSTPGDRRKRPPQKGDLVTSKSAILRYLVSTTLNVKHDSRDHSYTLPIIDPRTGVRVRNSYWLHRARTADIIVMNRGPIPAPAWTYEGDSPRGNWSFLQHISTSYPPLDNGGLAKRIVRAALHATLEDFLPGVMTSLRVIQMDPLIQRKTLVWHGSWYLRPQCTNIDFLRGGQLFVDPLMPQSASTDPWTLYYNAQVYMQTRILSKILQRHNIVFLTYAFPKAPDFSLLGPGRHHSPICNANPLALAGGNMTEGFLMDSMNRVLKIVL